MSSSIIYHFPLCLNITNTMHWFVPLLYSIYWHQHFSTAACHLQGAS
jgi:hypothetical protein